MLETYRHTLLWVLDNPGLTLVVLLLTIVLNVVLIVKIPKGFFPQQDTGAIVGGVQGPQDSSFPADGQFDPAAGQRDQKRSRRRQCKRLHWRQRGHQYGDLSTSLSKPLDVRKSGCSADHQPTTTEVKPFARGFGFLAGISRPAHWRPIEQRTLSIHHSVRQRSGSVEMGAYPLARDEKASWAAGC